MRESKAMHFLDLSDAIAVRSLFSVPLSLILSMPFKQVKTVSDLEYLSGGELFMQLEREGIFMDDMAW